MELNLQRRLGRFALGLGVTLSFMFALPCFSLAEETAASRPGYAIVATPGVLESPEWNQVVESLKAKRSDNFEVTVIKWDDAAFDSLREAFPQYVCFVVQPTEATIDRLATIWQKTRQLDDDPYGDVIWGIITGYDAADALRLTKTEDVQIESVCGATSIALDYFKSGFVFDESRKNHWRTKNVGEEPQDRNDAPDDTTHAIADALNESQLFVTSGHASERNWSIGYAYKNGFFVAKDGDLIGVPSNDKPFKIQAKTSKIHLASGNCLWGNIDKPDCMALATIRNLNVDMFVGYVVPTWFGYMGWGVQDYYIEQPGRFTVAEAFFANNQALLYLLEKDAQAEANKSNDRLDKQTLEGLKYDRDVVVLYGDPAWKNALCPQESGWEQTLTSEKDAEGRTVWTLTLKPLRGNDSFKLVEGNGSQRSGRPIFQILPQRVFDVNVVEGQELNPVVTDNFVMVPMKGVSTEQTVVVKFTSK